MPRNEPQYLDLHREADKAEPRVARSVARAADTLSARVKVTELAEAIEAGAGVAAAYFADLDIADAYTPLGRILADTVIKGAKIAAKDLD